jgi:hypothetical protein
MNRSLKIIAVIAALCFPMLALDRAYFTAPLLLRFK